MKKKRRDLKKEKREMGGYSKSDSSRMNKLVMRHAVGVVDKLLSYDSLHSLQSHQ